MDLQTIIRDGWRISPLDTAMNMTSRDPSPIKAFPHSRYLSNAIRDTIATAGRLIVSMPPQFGKSTIISEWTPPWYLELFPERNIILCGYGNDFAKDWGKTVRNNIDHYGDKFSVKLRDDSQQADRWRTVQGGGMLCAGIGGGITGKKADLLIIDDPIKGDKDASSFTMRDSVGKWFWKEAHTRIHNHTAVIIVLTRWHEDDLVGRLLKKNSMGFRVINMPAIWDEEAAKNGVCPIGRKIGDSLCPELHSPRKLFEVMEEDEDAFVSLYQGRPGSQGNKGNVYKGFSPKNVRELSYDPRKRVFWSLDFNVDPMSSVYGQYTSDDSLDIYSTGEKSIEVLDEIIMPNSDTKEMTLEFIARMKKMVGSWGSVHVEIYGDPAAKARHSSQVGGTDYEIIKTLLRTHASGFINYTMRVGAKAPVIVDRINCVKVMLETATGRRRLIVDPKCKQLIRDFNNVRWKKDANGNTTGQIDKGEPSLTHVSDALGYFVERRFPKSQQAPQLQGIMQ